MKHWQHPFLAFPENWVRAAFAQALQADTSDTVSCAMEVCQRWQANPYAPDCPPAYGRIAIPATVPTETILASAPRMPRIRSILARHNLPEVREAFEKRRFSGERTAEEA